MELENLRQEAASDCHDARQMLFLGGTAFPTRRESVLPILVSVVSFEHPSGTIIDRFLDSTQGCTLFHSLRIDRGPFTTESTPFRHVPVVE